MKLFQGFHQLDAGKRHSKLVGNLPGLIEVCLGYWKGVCVRADNATKIFPSTWMGRTRTAVISSPVSGARNSGMRSLGKTSCWW